jgi:hypothetical protein
MNRNYFDAPRSAELGSGGKVSALEMKCWIEHYELSEIVGHAVPVASMDLAATAR